MGLKLYVTPFGNRCLAAGLLGLHMANLLGTPTPRTHWQRQVPPTNAQTSPAASPLAAWRRSAVCGVLRLT